MVLPCKDSENPREIIRPNPFSNPYHSPSPARTTNLRPSDHTTCRPDDEKEENEEQEDGRKPADPRTMTFTGRILRPRALGAEEDKDDKKRTRAKLHVKLSKEEIEDDLIAMTGSKPPRRPKRKHKMSVQNRLNSIFPGFGLPETISADRYKVSEPR
ncbi:uncharacterized protein LOC113463073 [Phoenix dactylifera]|uniref:Uncharacterized protein LOC113463073 n=1 Tax=Phoenix dactylifera TaxID=42345 RepID=A0A8B8J7L0_PHODC|nr:uncharacterized protein LOC113463073 [Phoenix dactylifera]